MGLPPPPSAILALQLPDALDLRLGQAFTQSPHFQPNRIVGGCPAPVQHVTGIDDADPSATFYFPEPLCLYSPSHAVVFRKRKDLGPHGVVCNDDRPLLDVVSIPCLEEWPRTVKSDVHQPLML